MNRFMLNVILLFATLAIFVPRHADATAVYCVSDVAGFKNALAAYAKPDRTEDIQIKLQQGTYAIGTLSDFYQGDGSNYKLSILGGYGASCATRTINPANTVYDGQNGPNNGLELSLDGDLLIEGITFTNMRIGVTVSWRNGPDGNTAEVRYNIFKNDTLLCDGCDPLFVIGDPNETVLIHDNLLYGNAEVSHNNDFLTAALHVMLNDGAVAWIVNNTVAGNPGTVGLSLVGNSGTHVFFAYDNIVWNNYLDDITITDYDSTTVDLYNNTYSVLSGSATSLNTGSNKTGVANDPQFFNPAAGDFHLVNASTSINTGAAAVPLYTYPARDNDGGARLTGSRVDRGAFESTIDDVTNLVVSTTGDNNNNTTPTVGSIRWAIKQANNNASASTITFSTLCPSVFNLPSQLPDITSDVTIDGYHTSAGADVAGASQNADANGFNASLCPYLDGGNGIADGLRTAGSGRLTVTGLGFSGFTDAAIKLPTGSGHFVAGNQIGAVPFKTANHDGIRITGTASGAAIGDGSAAGYNWIADNTDVGVYIDNATGGVAVKGNLIGLDASGSGSAGNAYGVYIGNSQKNTLAFNLIADNVNAGVTLSGISTQFNVLQYNSIGITPSGGDEGNGGAGLLINAGAANNTIGAPQAGSGGGNYIAYNGGQGVWITGGGVGNRVLGNQDYGNTGLSIDLDTAGPNANDALDSDGGPDDLQNFPLLSGATRNGPNLTVTGNLHTFANDSFRVDFYRSDACRTINGSTRGDARYFVGRGSVLSDANGNGHFSLTLPVGAGSPGVISATATAANGDTSEMGGCVTEDTLFKDAFER